jgi:general nucleoside transport system permease protein
MGQDSILQTIGRGATAVGKAIRIPVLAVLTAVIVGSLFMLANGFNPLAAYSGLADGAFGSSRGISRTILNAVPFIFAGLSVAFAFKGGLFNIGAEGQLFMGAVSSAAVGVLVTGLPPFLHLTLAIMAGFAGGALWGAIPGALKAYTGAHEVITTIMFNFIGIILAGWLVSQGGVNQQPGPLRDPNPANIVARTERVAESARLPVLAEWGEPIHLGVILALLTAVFIWWLVWKTPFGFELRMVGLNPSAARYAGVNVPRTTILTMVIAGGLAGLAGAVETLGRNHYFAPNFNVGYGFDSIAIALLGQTHPVGVVLASFLFGAMNAGTTRMQLSAGVPAEIIQVVQALILAFVAASEIIRYIYRIRTAAGEEEQRSFSAGWGQR